MQPVFYDIFNASLCLGFSFMSAQNLNQHIEQTKKGDPPS